MKPFALVLFITFFASNTIMAQCPLPEQKIFSSPNTSFNLQETGFNSSGALVAGGTAYQPLSAAIATFRDNNTNLGMFKTYSDFWLKKIAVASNNDIYAVGWSYSEQSSITLLVMRLTPDGDIKWVKRLQDTFSSDNWQLVRVEPQSAYGTSDGGLVICGSKEFQLPGSNNYRYKNFVLKLDVDGNVAWSRQDTNNADDENFSVVERNGFVYVAGTTSLNTMYATLMKLNLQTGSMFSLLGYQLQTIGSNTFRDIHATPYGFLAAAQAYSTNGYKNGYYVVKLDTAGAVITQKQLNFSGSSYMDPYYEVMPTPDGGCLVWLNDKINVYSTREAKLYKLDKNLSVEWQKYYPAPTGKMGADIYKSWYENGMYRALGMSVNPSYNNNYRYSRLFSIMDDGMLVGCATENTNLDIKDSLTYTSKPITWANNYSMVFVAPFTKDITIGTPGTTKEVLCPYTCNMQDFTVSGDTTLCGTTTTILKATHVGECALNFEWSVDSSYASLVTINDTTVQLTVKKNGNGRLTVKWKSYCKTIEKNINIYSNPVLPQVPNLGKDTSICSGDTLQLHVDNPYPYIVWNNNSKNNNVKVTAAGMYWAKVSMDSMCFASDTMMVKQLYPKPSINMQPTAALCLPDPLVLKPGGSNLQYTWQDGTTNSTYEVYKTGTYWVTASNSYGCTTADTVRISASFQKPANFISFKDSALCIGEKVLLTLNQPFRQYNWNNGSASTAQYMVNHPGTYTIKVTDVNGCSNIDSITLKDNGCAMGIYFPNAFVPNGINKQFRPLIQGAILETLHLVVLNHNGVVMFESSDAIKGWDGRYKNKLQPSDVYVWYCTYKFNGQPTKVVKGSVLLID